jgi:hypothetical protein
MNRGQGILSDGVKIEMQIPIGKDKEMNAPKCGCGVDLVLSHNCIRAVLLHHLVVEPED